MKSEECAGSVSGTTVAARAKRRPRAREAVEAGRPRGGVAVAADVVGPRGVERHHEQVARPAAEREASHPRSPHEEEASGGEHDDEGERESTELGAFTPFSAAPSCESNSRT